jgi:hypothetical protein
VGSGGLAPRGGGERGGGGLAEAVAGRRLPREAGERATRMGRPGKNEGVGPGPREIVKFSI